MDSPWLPVLGGLLGSAHCVGMCGGFVMSVGSGGGGRRRALARQLIYASGRVTVYALLGAVAGFIGLKAASEWSMATAWLMIAAGFVLVWQGVEAAGFWPKRSSQTCGFAGVFALIWGGARASSLFLAGALNGLLPCGLLYGFLAVAAASGGMISGAATMALFGLGTVPALALFGGGAGSLSVAWRRKILTAAALLVATTGTVMAYRGVLQLTTEQPVACPLCR